MNKLSIQTSGVCNLKCSYCGYRVKGETEFATEKLPMDQIRRALKKYKIVDVDIVGAFETTLNDDFVELYKTVCGENRKVLITTNVCARPLEWWRKLLKQTRTQSDVYIEGSLHLEHGVIGNLKELFELHGVIKSVRQARTDIRLCAGYTLVGVPANLRLLRKVYGIEEKYREFIREWVIVKNEERDSEEKLTAMVQDAGRQLGFEVKSRFDPRNSNLMCKYYNNRLAFKPNPENGKYRFGKYDDNGIFTEIIL
jgi:hypothetical protein